MSKFNPDKLHVDFRNGVTRISPIIPRRYTLTHSDITAELFLVIAPNYAKDKIAKERDEVLGEWVLTDTGYYYNVNLLVDGQFGRVKAAIRNAIFRKELPLALTAIRYGDRRFFDTHIELNNAPIIVHFNSSIPAYNRTENWETIKQYMYL